ncbi:MAG TPA: NAD-dependent epimerase/dehydratase family protein [Stellaceae bacterium]|nr:NAD-dependent epimerase/dehydratase family protein [Stellaceae bacterium]
MPESRPVILVGGAGFIGRALAAQLAARGIPVVAVTRTPVSLGPGIVVRAAGDLSAATDWPSLLAGAGMAVHLASRAHAPIAASAEEDWIAAEAATAAALGHAAGRAGIERLVLMSSIKVLGETSGATRFRAIDIPAPRDAYGRAKLRIEDAMAEAASESGVPLVVLRPPLVYGPGVKANFLALLRLVDRGLPLPFASIDNRRSLIFLDNLIDLVALALSHPAAPGNRFLLRDDDEVSTPALVRHIAQALGRPARLFPCPPALLRGFAALARRAETAERLLGSLRVDDGATRAMLGWQPRVTLADGLAATCRWFRGGGRDSGSRP